MSGVCGVLATALLVLHCCAEQSIATRSLPHEAARARRVGTPALKRWLIRFTSFRDLGTTYTNGHDTATLGVAQHALGCQKGACCRDAEGTIEHRLVTVAIQQLLTHPLSGRPNHSLGEAVHSSQIFTQHLEIPVERRTDCAPFCSVAFCKIDFDRTHLPQFSCTAATRRAT